MNVNRCRAHLAISSAGYLSLGSSIETLKDLRSDIHQWRYEYVKNR